MMDIFERAGADDGYEAPLLGRVDPRASTEVDFSHYDFYKRTVADIVTAFKTISPGITTLNLSHNGLNKCSLPTLVSVFAAIPTNITTLIISANDLQNKTEAEWITILSALPHTINNIISDTATQNKITPILQKVQEQAFNSMSIFLVPELANVVLNYAVNTAYFNHCQSAEQKITPEIKAAPFFSCCYPRKKPLGQKLVASETNLNKVTLR